MLDNLRLLENEEILLETKAINKQNKIIMGLPIFVIIFLLILLFYINYLFLLFSFPPKLFYIPLVLNFVIIGPIFLLFIIIEMTLRENKNTYIITNRRVIKVPGTVLIFRNPQIYEIYLEDIAFVQMTTFIHIVQKGPRGEFHYSEKDVKYYDLLPPLVLNIKNPKLEYINLVNKIKRQSSHFRQRPEFNDIVYRVKRIWFDIKGKNTIQIREKIIDLLTDLIPLRKHPNLDNVYLNTS